MVRSIAMLLMIVSIGCSDPTIPKPNPSERVAVYHDVTGGTARLSDEFAQACQTLLSKPGTPIGEAVPVKGKAHGSIMLPNRKSFDLYGNFVTNSGEYWASPVLEQFSKAIADGDPMSAITFKPDDSYQAEFIEPTAMTY